MEKTKVVDYLQMVYPRFGFLRGITITGGEPTLHDYLPDFLKELKQQGYDIKLDTNASKPKRLQLLIERGLVDYFSVFLVAPIDKYPEVARYRIKPETMQRSIQIIRKSEVPHEWVVMPVPGITEFEDIESIAQSVAGSRRFIIRRFEQEKTLDPRCIDIEPFSDEELKELREMVAPYFHEVNVEGIRTLTLI
jgi:pyruvate formate lyase activating enzyme